MRRRQMRMGVLEEERRAEATVNALDRRGHREPLDLAHGGEAQLAPLYAKRRGQCWACLDLGSAGGLPPFF